ncbi:MAG: phenylalanine--tRNA ligase subunit alpha, partial [Ruminiclostridium sp.]|nr:phenylalanine--tRNA ligase subunit alpha [Ruminiclostridium sp.]
MKEQLRAINAEALESREKVKDIKGLEEIRVSFLGKKGKLTGVLKGMGSL